MDISDFKALTDEELEAARIALLSERERRDIVATAAQKIDQINAVYSDAAATQAPTPKSAIGDRFGPGQKFVWSDGNTYQNISGAWLPSTANPTTYPQGFKQLTGLPKPADVTAWAAGQTVRVGDLRAYQGKTYRCLQAHTTQASWEPSAAPALWSLA